MRLIRYGENKLALRARANRQELIAARLSRRDMVRMGLLGTGGFLVAQRGLSAWASRGSADNLGLDSPRLEPFVEPLPIMPVLPARPKSALNPAPTIQPNTRINPANGLPFEGRSEPHQFRTRHLPCWDG